MSLSAAILGHDVQMRQIKSDIASGNVAHAYLFLGPEHIGKTMVARWFVYELLRLSSDLSAGQTADQIERLIHPDFLSLDELWVEEQQEDWQQIARSSNIPQQHRAKATKARTDTISIEDVRALQERLYERPLSFYRCCFIRSVDRLQTEAANALLKVLEEPPSKLVFILTAVSEHEVLPTILSRTRVMHFHSASALVMAPVLREADEADRPFIVHLSQGAIGMALSLLRNPEALRAEKLLHGQAVQFWESSSRHDRLKWLTEMASKPPQLERAVMHLGVALKESKNLECKPQRMQAYMDLLKNLRTNAHRGLIVEHFGLAVSA